MVGRSVETASGNAEMAAAWDGPEGEHWAEHAEQYESAATAFTRVLVDAVPVEDESAVLDIGCGTGALTLALALRAGGGSALGVDLSSRQLERARAAAAAEGRDRVRFEQADAQVHPFQAETFDIVVSSFGAMFFADPVAAFSNIRRAMRPGASLTLMAWRDLDRNEWICEFRAALAAGRDLPTPPPNVPSPFGMADRDLTTERLTAAGFDAITFESVDEPMRFGQDAGDAWAFISTLGIVRGLTADLDEGSRRDALGRLRASIEAHETSGGVRFPASAWLITARNGVA